MSGRRDWLWAGLPAGNAMGCQHSSCVGQVMLTSKSELLQCIPPASVCSQKIPIIGASSALRDCKKKASPNPGNMGRNPPPLQTLFEAGRRGGESSFSLQKAAAPQEERHQIKCSRVDAETLRKKKLKRKC